MIRGKTPESYFMKISGIRKVPLFSLASVLLQLGVYLYSIDQASDQRPRLDFLTILGVNGAVSYLSLILVAIGNVVPVGLFGRLEEFFWKTCLVSFYSLLGLSSTAFLLGIIGIFIRMSEGPCT